MIRARRFRNNVDQIKRLPMLQKSRTRLTYQPWVRPQQLPGPAQPAALSGEDPQQAVSPGPGMDRLPV